MTIHQKPSPNFDDRAVDAPSFLILHYTGMESAEAAMDRLCDPAAKVSAHYTVDEDGQIYQHVPEDKRAWHAGVSYWQGETDLNSLSIGVELVNPGHEYGYVLFPAAQIDALIPLAQKIIQKYAIESAHVLAHADIAPARKDDPGELFPWQTLAEAGVGRWPSPSDEDFVRGGGIIVSRALDDLGYDPRVKFRDRLIAFQRHFVPEVFTEGRAGQETSLTKARLYALLAEHHLQKTQD